ncbi:Sarcosine oxidase delta subunit [Granulibacter bethesdensis]|uniref:sarcosine oxidase subunit delta n=1 Tax=Granulibacter bethesdensis TaxID=364410 RepID=UPI00090ADE4A|nr:sarcosine oxidase subunit delta [Granulibacter bethesdensis]APH55957.1 Sarcosine oxidase delta subunit [Granulibacter bethesdensis]
MRIACPCCGPRGLEEFLYRGDATRTLPAASARTEAWADYTYLRDNPAGGHEEYWFHAAGCQNWLRVRRDTRDHSILSVILARDPSASATGEVR